MKHGGARPGAGRKAIYGDPMKKIQILIPEDLYKKAADKARQEGKSLSEIVREIMSKHI